MPIESPPMDKSMLPILEMYLDYALKIGDIDWADRLMITIDQIELEE